MPFILNRCRRGKWAMLCALLPFVASARGFGLSLHAKANIDSSSKRTWDSLSKKICQRDHALKKQIRKKTDSLYALSGRNYELPKELIQLMDRKSALDSVLRNLKKLKRSKTTYAVVLITDTSTQEGGTTYQHPTRSSPREKIVFEVAGAASFAHETTHGRQFENGEIAYKKDTGGPFGDDLDDEAAAYRAQYGYDTDSVAGLRSSTVIDVFSDIKPDWVKSLTKPNGDKPYACGGSAMIAQLPVNMHSTREQILDAYRCVPGRETKWPPGYIPTADLNLFYKH